MTDEATGTLARAILTAADRRAQRAIEEAMPQWRYGLVTAVDTANRLATVDLPGPGAASPGFIYPRTMLPVVGDLVRVVMLPTGDRYVDAGFGLGRIGVEANSAGGTFGTGGYAAVPFAAADTFDLGDFHNPAANNSRLTVPAGLGGLFHINYLIDHSVSPGGATYIRKNGSAVAWVYGVGQVVGGGETVYHGNAELVLAAGDYVEVMLAIGSGTVHQGRFSMTRWPGA